MILLTFNIDEIKKTYSNIPKKILPSLMKHTACSSYAGYYGPPTPTPTALKGSLAIVVNECPTEKKIK